MRDVNSYMGKGVDRNWAGTCPVPPKAGMRGVPACRQAGELHLYFLGNLLHQGNGSHFRSLRLSPFQDFNPIDRFQ